jgi:hypothetical protein
MGTSPEIQALIDEVNAQHEALSGKDRLWCWYGLSRASWLTLPRVLMHEMPDEWQRRMAVLLEEFDEEFPNWTGDLHFYVSARRGGKMTPLPAALCDYRHPHLHDIDALRRQIASAEAA